MDSNNSTIQEPINSDQNKKQQSSDSKPTHEGINTNSYQSSKENEIDNDNESGSTWDENSISYQSKSGYIACLILAALSLIYIFQDIFTRQQFAKAGAEFIVDIQEWPANTTFLYSLSQVISNASFVVTAIIACAVVIWGQNRIYTFNYLICFSFAASMLSTLKLIYNDPRPYMEFTDVDGKECSAEYGNPSGHAMLNLFAAIYGISVMGNSFHKRFWWVCVIIGIFLVWVGFTRIHLGVHGINQVLLGWVYASMLFIVFRILLFQHVNKFLKYIALLPQNKIRKYSLLGVALYISHNLILLGIYLGVKDTYETSNDKWNGIIEKACNVNSIESISNKYLYNKCFIDSGISGAGYGLLLGIIYTTGTISNCHIYGKFQSKISILNIAKRLILIVIVPGSIFGITTLIFHFISVDITYWRFFFQLNIIGFICGFLVIYLSPKMLNRFSLEIEGDFLKTDADQSSPYSAEKTSTPISTKRIIHFNANIDLSNNPYRKSPNTTSQMNQSAIECQLMEVCSNNLNNSYSSDNNYNLQTASNSNKLQNNQSIKNQQLLIQNLKKVEFSNDFSLPHGNNATNTTLNSSFNNFNNASNKSMIKNEDNDNSNILKEVASPYSLSATDPNDQNSYKEKEIAFGKIEGEQNNQYFSKKSIEQSIDAKIQNSLNEDYYSNQQVTNFQNSMEHRNLPNDGSSPISKIAQNSYHFNNFNNDQQADPNNK